MSGPIVTTEAPAFRAALPAGGALIGLDLGTKTIGTALCDAGWSFASPADLIRRTKFTADKAAIAKLIAANIETRIPYTVDEAGAFTNEAPGFTGKRVITDKGEKGDANEAVMAELVKAGNLIARGLERGAPAVGFGIQYTPASSAWEILEIFRVAARGNLNAVAFPHETRMALGQFNTQNIIVFGQGRDGFAGHHDGSFGDWNGQHAAGHRGQHVTFLQLLARDVAFGDANRTRASSSSTSTPSPTRGAALESATGPLNGNDPSAIMWANRSNRPM